MMDEQIIRKVASTPLVSYSALAFLAIKVYYYFVDKLLPSNKLLLVQLLSIIIIAYFMRNYFREMSFINISIAGALVYAGSIAILLFTKLLPTIILSDELLSAVIFGAVTGVSFMIIGIKNYMRLNY